MISAYEAKWFIRGFLIRDDPLPYGIALRAWLSGKMWGCSTYLLAIAAAILGAVFFIGRWTA